MSARARFLDTLLGPRCRLGCGQRVFPRDVTAHEEAEHAGDLIPETAAAAAAVVVVDPGGDAMVAATVTDNGTLLSEPALTTAPAPDPYSWGPDLADLRRRASLAELDRDRYREGLEQLSTLLRHHVCHAQVFETDHSRARWQQVQHMVDGLLEGSL